MKNWLLNHQPRIDIESSYELFGYGNRLLWRSLVRRQEVAEIIAEILRCLLGENLRHRELVNQIVSYKALPISSHNSRNLIQVGTNVIGAHMTKN